VDSVAHFKDCNDKGEVVMPRTGLVDFHSILAAAGPSAVENYYVEFDHPVDQMGVARRYYDSKFL
jgi:hypothetical protein